MYIKSITLDGFKSYGTKQEIVGFDPQFNAITGLNGSGKSNILDSICFVLGIQNLQQVRATNLTELVYKNGQANVNRAIVSITFDNSSPKSGPMGYEKHKEICVTRTVITGGKSKYLINGVSANNSRVHDLFQSVQLNVNNPHFLIMQGRITKVLNMKPLEILSMIEEAAGTRMYEEKKESAIRNLEKKDSKLREINNMLDEHICPQLEKLKEERKEYTKYTKVVREHEQLQKIYVAWDYSRTEELVQKSAEEKEQLKKTYEEHEQLIESLKKQIEEADAKIDEIGKTMSGDCGAKLEAIEAALKDKQLVQSKFDTKLRNLKTELDEEKQKHKDHIKNLKEDKTSLAQKEKELINSKKKLEVLKGNSDKDNEAISAAENHFHAVNAGLSDAAGDEASIAAQLIAAGKDKKDAETEAASIEMSLKHMKAELVKKEAENKKVDKSYTESQALYQKYVNEIKSLKDEILKLNYREGTFESLVERERTLNQESNNCRGKIDNLYHSYPGLSFEYRDPQRNFDHSRVIGPVCKQVQVKDSKETLALEMVAGSGLYNIIVDNEETAKLLLSNGQLSRRITFIPLNKIQSFVIPGRMLQDAERIVGPDNVSVALSRLDYDKRIAPAINYIFGGHFICTNMKTANQVTFANNIKRPSVTLEGEVFNPAGTLSGGSMNSRVSVLPEAAAVKKLEREIEEKQGLLNQIRNEIRNIKQVKQRYDDLCQRLELKESEAQMQKTKIEQSTHYVKIQELEELKQSLKDKQDRLADCKAKQKSTESRIKELEVKSSKGARENKVKEAEKAVAECKKKAAASMKIFNSFQAEVNELAMEIDNINNGIPASEEQIETCAKAIEESEKHLQVAEANRKEIEEEVTKLTEELKSHRAIMKSHNSEISKISKNKDAMGKRIKDTELQLQDLKHKIESCGENTTDASKKLKYLLEKNKWITGQKKYFGVQNSEFDFSSFKPKEAIPRLKELEELKEKLHKNVNMRAQNMLSSVEEQYDNLIQKKGIVMNDKQVIEHVIRELDEQKKVSLRRACGQVNQDFGSIFRTLLPGTDAKLVPQPGKTVLEGLEFKIAFGDVWKESLNELSGGQRSLVALSLILALLLFNPAPIYILDEVDAALDLSHTQNIGKMLRMHFKKSQFIVVSLKDGMFNNANVLFRTKFHDGMSSITRTCQKQ